MHLASIWRYPVKSMAGERLARVRIDEDGLHGDRRYYVKAKGRLVTSRTRPRLLGLHARLGTGGHGEDVLVDDRAWDAPEIGARVVAAAGAGAAIVASEEGGIFDVLPLSVATDGALAAFGRDERRLRPNLVVAGVPGLAERTWPGRILRIGAVRIGVARLRPRCVMTTYDPDTLVQDVDVLKDIVRDFEGALALDCEVLEDGEVAEGDPVELEA